MQQGFSLLASGAGDTLMGVTRDKQLIDGFISAVSRQLRPCDYDHWYWLETSAEKVQVRFQNAGHILGSAYRNPPSS